MSQSASFFVLVVDDEPFARMIHLTAIAKLDDVSVIGASSVAEALAVIGQRAPQVVVLDMQLQDGTGIDVMSRLAEERHPVVLIVVSAHIDKFRHRLGSGNNIFLLSKPAPHSELLRIIESARRASQKPSPFSPIDYVQLACMGMHSVVVDCIGNEVCGEIIIHNGVLWAAKDEQGEGVPAFIRMVLADGALIRVLPARDPLPARSIEDSWESLILDAMREKDEAERVAPAQKRVKSSPSLPMPAPLEVPKGEAPKAKKDDSVSQPAPTAPTAPSAASSHSGRRTVLSDEQRATFDQYVERGVRAVIERSYDAAIAAFEQAQAMWPDEPLVRHRLERLRMLQKKVV